MLSGVTTGVWELQNSYEDSQNRRNRQLLSTWVVLNVYRFTFFVRVTAKSGFFFTPPPTGPATENGHHGTDHPSNISMLWWSALGNWWSILASLGALDYSLALDTFSVSGETH